jgi:hypothetical protein
MGLWEWPFKLSTFFLGWGRKYLLKLLRDEKIFLCLQKLQSDLILFHSLLKFLNVGGLRKRWGIPGSESFAVWSWRVVEWLEWKGWKLEFSETWWVQVGDWREKKNIGWAGKRQHLRTKSALGAAMVVRTSIDIDGQSLWFSEGF